MELAYDQAIAIIITQRIKILIQRDNVYTNIVYNSQIMETTLVSTD